MSEVSIKKCGSYDDSEIYSAVKGAVCLLGGIERFIRPGERILIKPNLLAGKPPEAAVTTHPSVVRAAIRLVREAGAAPVVGDSPGLGTARNAAQKCGVLSVCEEEGVELIELKELVVAQNPGGHTFKRIEVAREAIECDGIVNLPKLKTHAQMFLTLAVKNLFGCVPGKLKPQWHLSAGVESAHFAAMLLDLCQFLSPRLTIMDGVVGMEGNGPGSGDPRQIGLIFAGPDCVAIDALTAEILGAPARKVPILAAALDRGIRTAETANITALGEAPSIIRIKDFRFARPLSTNFAAMLPGFLDKPVRKALTARPHVDHSKCTLCGVCVGVCPAEVMTRLGKIEIDYGRCIRCYCCQEMCPEGAIYPREGWLKRLIPGF